jgi:hypothetical protein
VPSARAAWGSLAARPVRSAAALGALAALAVAWVLVAHALWHSSVPASLQLPHVDPRSLFSPSFLRRSESFERFLDVDVCSPTSRCSSCSRCTPATGTG